jgi:hypothetical protein
VRKLDRLHQIVKDCIAFPALSGRRGFKSTLKANFAANIVRNVWAYAIIFCGHFPDQTYTDFAPGRYFLAARLDAVDLEERVDAVRPPAALRVAVFRVVRLF